MDFNANKREVAEVATNSHESHDIEIDGVSDGKRNPNVDEMNWNEGNGLLDSNHGSEKKRSKISEDIMVGPANTLMRPAETMGPSDTLVGPARPINRRGSRSEYVGEGPADGSWPPKEWPVADSLSFTRALIFYGEGTVTGQENEDATRMIQEARRFRTKYHKGEGVTVGGIGADRYRFGANGVVEIFYGDEETNLCCVPDLDTYVHDYNRLVEIVSDGKVRTYSFQRLEMLSKLFKIHKITNGSSEHQAQSKLLGADFYSTMKIDNHIHLAAAASAKMFVEFVRRKLKTECDTVVHEGQTLREVFENAGIDSDHLTIDAFNVLADYSVYQRFDNFNSNFSPFRLTHMRKIFLKTENEIDGRFFAELTKVIFSRLEASKGHKAATEMRLSLYGMERKEWLNLAKWVMRDWDGEYPGPVLSSHNRWLVQIPRLWRIYKAKKDQNGSLSFQVMLENIFVPLFDATINPNENKEIAELLQHIVGFDSVDDEGAAEAPCSNTTANAWTSATNPAYSWQLYYLWANIEVLNHLRKSRGLNTFSFRPHAGETGDPMHLAAAYMLSKSINHGITLDKQVSLQYLYYLDQVGISVSPLSNNFLFRKIASNPLPKFFKRGMNVTLSTDDPLLFHMSDDALLEEYTVARSSFDFSMTDMTELARNSIFQSDFDDHSKQYWLGQNYKQGVTQCDARKTQVPLMRAKFRAEHLAQEEMLLSLIANGKGKDFLKDMMVQFSYAREGHRDVLAKNAINIPYSL
mmetsp:Transcript_5129/g.10342  ORF Transcript_5129/g.10342 Transcript_5129/m.10342 type:complete len:749 (-) Transcript_5129:200-2446(-)